MKTIHPAIAEHAMEENEKLRGLLRDTASVAITMLYDSHKDDVLAEFKLPELEAVVEASRHLQDARVERVYRAAWDAALSQQAEPVCPFCGEPSDHCNQSFPHPSKPAPAQDEREAFKRALHSQKVFKLSSATMSAAEWAWFARPAQTEQQPVAWVHPNYLRDNALGFEASQCRLSPLQVPLYTIPLAQAAPSCNHHFMYFGEQKKRRCADCCVVEGNEQSAQGGAE